MRYVLVGNYGVENLGDEALKDYFLTRLPEVQWSVVSFAPDATDYPRLPGGIRSLFRPWWRTLRAIYSADGLVFGGGTLFTDIESLSACFLWGSYALVARFLGKPVFLAFQGYGPFRTKVGEWIAKKVYFLSAYISVRDNSSFDRLQKTLHESGESNTNVVLTFDPVISLLEIKKTDISAKELIIIPRDNSSQKFIDECVKICTSQQWSKVRIFSFLQQGDKESIASIESALGSSIPVDIVVLQSMMQLPTALQHAAFILTQRYHGAIAALALGIPFKTVPLHAGDKLEAVSSIDANDARSLVETGKMSLLSALEKWSTGT